MVFFSFNLGGKYPANSETVYAGLQFASGSLRDVPSERMYHTLWDDVRGLGQKAAKGYFIIDLLRRGSSRIDEAAANRVRYPLIERTVTATKSDYTTGGPTVSGGFAGRVFYSGFNGEVVDGDARSPSLTNFIVFSQLVKSVGDINKCYQEGDPTSRESSEVVDTDGGFIKIAGAEKIIGLRALGNSLIVFATNGVWEVQGGSDYGFSATNYKVTKLSSIGAFSESAIVEEVGRLFFWGEDGIYTVGKDQFESMTVKNITQTTIQTLYDNIPSVSKSFAAGVYDSFAKKVRWVYNLGTPFTVSSDNRELVLDLVLNAFYENRIANIDQHTEVYGCFSTSPFIIGQDATNVIANTDNVIANTDNVVIGSVVRESRLQSVKYISMVMPQTGPSGVHLVFTVYNNTKFLDWETFNGVGSDAKAYLLTGARTMGDSAIDKQTPYLVMHFRRTENGVDVNGDLVNQSSCFMRTQWDFANTAESMKFTPLVQTYRYILPRLIMAPNYDTGFDIITTKNKVRGRGKAFSMYLETEPLKDCRILGWNLSVNANSVT
ncbi:hypothetical protein D3C85_864660 [compost metagenome]